MANQNRGLYNVYVVDPRGAGKLLKVVQGVIAEDEKQATLKAGVAQVAAEVGLEIEQIDFYAELISAFIRPKRDTQKVVIAKDEEN